MAAPGALGSRAQMSSPLIGEGLLDPWGNHWLEQVSLTTATNYWAVETSISGGGPGLTARGVDVDVDANLTPKGAGSIRLNGPVVIGGALSIGGTLDVTGATHLHSTLLVDGATTVDDTLHVTGIATFDASIDMTAAASQLRPGATSFAVTDHGGTNNNLLVAEIGDVTVRRDLAVGRDLGVTRDLSVTRNTVITGTLGVSGTSTLGVLNAGATTVTTLHATGAATLDTTLLVTGTSHLVGVLTADSQAIFGATIDMTALVSQLRPGSTSFAVTNHAGTLNNLLVVEAGDTTTLRDLTVGRNLGVTVNATVGGTLGAGATTVTTLHATSTGQIDGNLTLGARLIMTTGASKLVPGATSFAVTETTGTTDNLLVADIGDVTIRRDLAVNRSLGVTLNATVGGTLGVTGIGTFATGLSVTTGGATVNGGLTVNSMPGNVLVLSVGTAAVAVTGTLDVSSTTTLAAGLVMTATASQLRPGATSFAVRNNAGTLDNLLVVDAGDVTVRHNLTVSNNGTIAVDLTVNGNITNAGQIRMNAAASQLRPGATSFAIRNNADSANNLLITDAGVVTTRDQLVVTTGGASIGGNSTVTGTLTATAGLTVSAGGIGITAGGLTVTAGGLTVTAGGLTVSANGADVTGNSTVHGTLNVTSDVLFDGFLDMTVGASKLRPGGTSFAIMDHAGANDNLLVTNAGAVTVRAGLLVGGDPTATVGYTGLGTTTGIGNGVATNIQAPLKGTGSGPASPTSVAGFVRLTTGATSAWIPYFV